MSQSSSLCMQTSHQLQVDAAILDQLRSELEGLMTELTDASRRNDELMTEKDNDLALIRDLEVQVKEYKRKYEQAKTELRSVKGECLSCYLHHCRLNGNC